MNLGETLRGEMRARHTRNDKVLCQVCKCSNVIPTGCRGAVALKNEVCAPWENRAIRQRTLGKREGSARDIGTGENARLLGGLASSRYARNVANSLTRFPYRSKFPDIL